MSGGSLPEATPPGALRRALRACVGGDAWAAELVAELDAEYARRVGPGSGARLRARLWYARQLVAPQTLRFAWMMRRRRRGAGRKRFVTRGGGPMSAAEGWGQDFRQAARGLAREWRFALFVAATLSLGIGGNAAMYGVADRLFLRGPAHVAAPAALVRLYLRFDDEQTGTRLTPWIPYRVAEAIRTGSTGFTAVALQRSQPLLAEVGGTAGPLTVSTVGDGYFALLGTQPALGRFFGSGAPDGSEDAVVISHRLWTSRFDADPGVLGRTLSMADRVRTIVGVAPEGFTGSGLAPVDLWIPLDRAEAGSRNWHVLARVGGGATRAAPALADAEAVYRRTDPGRFFQWARGGKLVGAPVSSDDAGREPPEASIARLLTAVSALVLLIGIANVVNLLVVRVTRRRREVAVRLALGAGRLRLIRLLLAESLLLAVLAGLVSVPVAYGAGTLLRRVLLSDVSWPSSPLGGGVGWAAALVTLATGLLVGLLPARHAGRTDVIDGLRASSRGGGGRQLPLHAALAIAQVALSAVLLVGAGLFLRSFLTIRVTDLGVDAGAVTAITLRSLDPEAIPSPSDRELAVYLAAREAMTADPDVAASAVVLGLPFVYNFGLSVSVPGRDSIPALPGGGPYLTAVTAGYFHAVGTSLVQGRDFTPEEVAGDEPVIVVSASMARLLWPRSDPLGRCVRVGGDEGPCHRVVGVAEDVHRTGYREPPSMQYYVPLGPQSSFGGMALVLRRRSTKAGSLDRIRATLAGVDPAVDYVEATTLRSVLDPEVRPWRMGAWVLGMAAVVALLVSVVGVYGVLAYLVEQRRRELGIRIALGASGLDIRALVLRRALASAALGTTVGVALFLGATRWVQPLLFETSATDPVVLVVVAGVLFASATVASVLPAGRAARVQPAVCLNEE